MSPPFRLTGAKPHDPAVAAWFFDPGRPLRLMVRPWFDVLKGQGLLGELIHDHRPTLCLGDLAFAYVDAFTAHAAIGFFRGAHLPDPAGLLQGQGTSRHVKLRPGRPVDEPALHALIAAAWDDLRRLQ